ncbi:MAG: dihydroorotate dehydrogenase B catalytic subunit [Omnitrophica WOR_2 bacterium RIFCSPHIGHO2_02_FULL_50_17]|nr:MAG: dihydroorotate dehydrogenase B catalytic subunit [Omnitrophica WOR_2 bacterium RIFCSPHIGHO2_02_FULL_50_17]
MNLTVKIGKAEFANPVTVASGTFGCAQRYYNLDEIKGLGAITLKTVTLHARQGNPPPRIVETPSGMVNAIGIENPGADGFIEQKLPSLREIGVPLIISILGHTDKEFEILTEKFNALEGIHALELNLSCPNLGKKTLVAQDPKSTSRVVKLVKKASRLPVIAKLSPNVTDISVIARAAQDAGADAVSLVNTFAALVIDVKRKRPVLGNSSGGLSGPAIRPIAVYMVDRAAQAVSIPIIAMGGIMTAEDALQFILAGASMVAVGTANFINPRAPLEILAGIKKYMKENKLHDIQEIVGSVRA